MRTFLLATADGVWKADGARCERVALAGERVTVLASSPEPGVLYASTAGGRIFKSRDGGNRWDLKFETDPRNRFLSLAVSPHPPHPVYAGTWPADVFRAPDGEGWERVESFRKTEGSRYWIFPPPPHEPRATSFAFDPADPATLYATVEIGGLMKSVDGGASWRPMTNDVNRDTHVAVVHPRDPATLYVSTGFGSTHRPGVYRTRDGGATWAYRYRDMYPIYTWRMCIDPVRPEVLHVVAYPYAPGDWHNPTGTGGMLMRTEDAGETWTPLHKGVHLPTVNYVPKVTPDPENPGGALLALSPYLRPSADPKDDLPLKYYNLDGYISPSVDPPSQEGRIVRSGPDGRTWEVLAKNLPPLLDFLPLD
ncbi:MAG: WD40/YVTN/BNR-like repeat-containing protein [Nitrospinota bacterium]